MKKVRIEIHLSEAETRIIDLMSEKEARSRKNWCENVIKCEIYAGYTKNHDVKKKNNDNRPSYSA